MKTRIRLDQLCVEQGLASSREQARALILAGQILVDGQIHTKAGHAVVRGAMLERQGPTCPYVSRGGLKLAAGLAHFSIPVAGRLALDVGASTGGFTDCLLQHGAAHVIAVDVGYGQLAWSLRQNARVTVIERVNARSLQARMLREALPTGVDLWPPSLATLDVSFISLTLVLPAVAAVLGRPSDLIALVKPQFEAGRGQVGKGGVVRDPEVRGAAIAKVIDWARANAFEVAGGLDSPVAGPRGNVEHLLHLRLGPPTVID